MIKIESRPIKNTPWEYFFYVDFEGDISSVEVINAIKLIEEKFDLTPDGIINYLGLREPIYTQTTNYGHFGKPYLPWEKVIKL